MNYTEHANAENAKYLLSLTDEYWAVNIFDAEELNQNGEQYSQADYIKNAKIWLKKVIKENGKLKTSYKYSKQMGNQGRIYVRKFGVQSLQKDLRGFLCGEYYTDYDMVNAHIAVLRYIKEKFFPEIDTKTLDNYYINRAKCLSDFGVTKIEVLKILNQEWEYKGCNTFLKAISHEFRNLQTLIWESDDFIDVPKAGVKVKNKKGSFLNRVLCVYENKFLQEAIIKVKNIHVPYFDGFFRDVGDEEKILQLLNENEYGIKWSTKEHSDKIKIDETLVLPEYKSEYTLMKEKFEENHLMIKNPLTFIELEDGDVSFHKNNDFQILTAPWEYEENGKTLSFFNAWKKDRSRREYKVVDFIPDNNLCPANVFNMFVPFKAQYIEKNNRVDTTLFYELIDVLTNNRAPIKEYLLSYVSDIFQNSAKSPKTGILFKGIEGAGKDMLINFIRNIMCYDGSPLNKETSYVMDVSNLEQLFGKFNYGLSRKLIVNLSELKGKESYQYDGNLKTFVVADTHNIEKKGVDPWNERNHKRIFGTTNGDNSLNLSPHNRRWSVFLTAMPREKSFYEKLGPQLTNIEFLNSLYSEFMDFTITADITKPISTEEMEEMQELNVNPLYKFCYEFFKEKKVLEEPYKKYVYFGKKDKNDIFIRNNHFVEHMFVPWLSETLEYGNNYADKVGFKKLKLQMNKIGIGMKQKKINDTNYRCYNIKLDDDFQILKAHYDWDKWEEEATKL